ncbi:MAG: hypothetical protein JSU73_10300 [candidate division WOR-3 bacterium]|nr:MAG: hypothetical protein JSU73_10300 [candidate division WOR-3 bacterium]
MKRYTPAVLGFVFLAATCGRRQVPFELDWTRLVGGVEVREEGYSVRVTHDGGFVLGGMTQTKPTGGYPCPFVVRTNPEGEILWTQSYQFGGCAVFHVVEQTSDGGYIGVGYTEVGVGGRADCYLVKTDALGDTLWTRSYGTPELEVAYDVEELPDRGFLLVGFTNATEDNSHDIWLVRTDAEGRMVWNRTYGGNMDDVGYRVQRTQDGGFAVAGYRDGGFVPGYVVELTALLKDSCQAYLLKLDSLGEVEWEKTYGGPKPEAVMDAMQLWDGGYILAGLTRSNTAGQDDVYAVRTDRVGDTLWTFTIGGTDIDVAYSVDTTPSGGFILFGRTDSFEADSAGQKVRHKNALYAVELDRSGKVLWTWPFAVGFSDIGYCVRRAPGGGYVLSGAAVDRSINDVEAFLSRITP